MDCFKKARPHLGYPINKGPFPAKPPISVGSYGKGPSGASSFAGSSAPSGYQGAFHDRQRRADYNAWRRSGDWAALDVTAIVLWMAECAEPDIDDNLFAY
jgi:hypothetical protein